MSWLYCSAFGKFGVIIMSAGVSYRLSASRVDQVKNISCYLHERVIWRRRWGRDKEEEKEWYTIHGYGHLTSFLAKIQLPNNFQVYSLSSQNGKCKGSYVQKWTSVYPDWDIWVELGVVVDLGACEEYRECTNITILQPHACSALLNCNWRI